MYHPDHDKFLECMYNPNQKNMMGFRTHGPSVFTCHAIAEKPPQRAAETPEMPKKRKDLLHGNLWKRLGLAGAIFRKGLQKIVLNLFRDAHFLLKNHPSA